MTLIKMILKIQQVKTLTIYLKKLKKLKKKKTEMLMGTGTGTGVGIPILLKKCYKVKLEKMIIIDILFNNWDKLILNFLILKILENLKDIVDNVKVIKDNQLLLIIKLWLWLKRNTKMVLQISLNRVVVLKNLNRIIIYVQKFGVQKVKYQWQCNNLKRTIWNATEVIVLKSQLY